MNMKMTRDKLISFTEMMSNEIRGIGGSVELNTNGTYERTEIIVSHPCINKTYFIYWDKTKSLTEAAVSVLVDFNKELYTCREYCNKDFETTRSICQITRDALTIKEVIFNPPATIVYWMDGTKTVVKDQGEGYFDPEKGLAMAISKKALGNKGNYYNQFVKWIEPWEAKHAEEHDSAVAELVDKLREMFGPAIVVTK